MRRALVALTLLACGGASSTAPDASVDAALVDAGVDATDAGACAVVTHPPACSSAERTRRLRDALAKPLVPRGSCYGIDVFGASMQGATLPDVEASLCAADMQGDLFGDGTCVATWGQNAELRAQFDPTTLRVRSLDAYQTPSSTPIAFHSPDGAHTYSTGDASHPVTKDGAAFLLDWGGPSFDTEVDELHRALLATFVPTAAQPPTGTVCATTGDCKATTLGDLGWIDFRKVGVAFSVANIHAGQPTASTFAKVVCELPPYP